MPELSFINLLSKIKTGKETFPVTILYGYNEFLGEKIIHAFSDTFLQERNEFNYRRYYFDSEFSETSWQDLINEANTSSFFLQSRKLIVATIRDEKKISLDKYEKELLKKYAESPNSNTILVIYFSLNLTKDEFKTLKTQKITKFVSELTSPNTYTIDFDKMTESDVKNYIKQYLNAGGMTITVSALDKIVENKEDDFISVLCQLPNLAIAVVQDKGIDSEDIDQIVTGVEAHSIWDLSDAIETEDTGKYLKILKYLFMNGTKAALVIGTLVTHYNKIYVAKFLLKNKVPVSQIGKELGQHSFFLNKFIDSARNFSDAKLAQILKVIYDLDWQSKTASEESARLSLQSFAFRIKLMQAKKTGRR